jgi:ABC-type phosphate transport system permease subunit
MTRGLIAAYHELDALVDGIETLKKKKFMTFTVYTPTPRHEIEHAVKPPISPIRLFTLIGGLCGVTFGYWIAIWTSDYWPLVVGGKAFASWIPYTIIGFEVMVLVGALSTVYGMFILSRVPKITQTIGFDERFTGGHYGIYVEAEPERLKEAEAVLRDSGAVEVRNER